MTPEQLLLSRYGEVPLTYVGDLKIVSAADPENTSREMAVYAARIHSRNSIPYNLLIAMVPLQLDSEVLQTTLGELPWMNIYLRSYFDLKKLQMSISLDWRVIAETPEYPPNSDPLPGGLWIQEVREKTGRGQRNRYYTIRDPSLSGNYVISVESRSRNVEHGNSLADSYELDLLLSFDNYNLAIERFTLPGQENSGNVPS